MRILSLWLLFSTAWAGQKLVVLEAVGPSDVQAERLTWWTDVVRGVVRVHAPANMQILTRESIVALLPPGVALADCDDECEISTGRRIGAEYVVGIRVRPADGATAESWTITVALHATIDGRLVGQGQITVSPAEVEAGLKQATTQAMAAVAPRAMPDAAQHPERIMARPLQWMGAPILRVESALDAPLQITVAGRSAGKTPVNLLLDGTEHITLSAAADGYQTRRVKVVTAGRSSQIALTLPSAHADVFFNVPLPDVEVHLSGRSLHGRQQVIQAGSYRVHIKHRCLESVPFEATFLAGEQRIVEVPHRLICGNLRITSAAPNAEILWRGQAHRLPFESPVETETTTPITVRAPGYLPSTLEVVNDRASMQTIDVPLRLDTVDVAVHVRRWNHAPCAAPVYVNGEQVGIAPWAGPVRRGRHTISAECGATMRRRVTLNRDQSLRFTQPGRHLELMVTSTGLNSGLLTFRVWSGTHRQGVLRLGIGATVGSIGLRDRQTTGFGIEAGLGVALTDALELSGGVMGAFGTRSCTDAEVVGKSTSERNFGCLHGYGELRGLLRYHHDLWVLEGGWAWTQQRYLGTHARQGPHLGVGVSF